MNGDARSSDGEVAAADDDARRRVSETQMPAGLRGGEPVAEQHERPQRDEQRRDRLQQQAVDRSCVYCSAE